MDHKRVCGRREVQAHNEKIYSTESQGLGVTTGEPNAFYDGELFGSLPNKNGLSYPGRLVTFSNFIPIDSRGRFLSGQLDFEFGWRSRYGTSPGERSGISPTEGMLFVSSRSTRSRDHPENDADLLLLRVTDNIPRPAQELAIESYLRVSSRVATLIFARRMDVVESRQLRNIYHQVHKAHEQHQLGWWDHQDCRWLVHRKEALPLAQQLRAFMEIEVPPASSKPSLFRTDIIPIPEKSRLHPELHPVPGQVLALPGGTDGNFHLVEVTKVKPEYTLVRPLVQEENQREMNRGIRLLPARIAAGHLLRAPMAERIS